MASNSVSRVLYFVHDNPHPAGGVWTIYRHVALLNRNGIPAYAVHFKEGFKPDWGIDAVPTIYSEHGLPLEPSDVLVIPENFGIFPKLKPLAVRKVVFCQNHFYTFGALPTGETWQTLGISRAMAGSQEIARFLREDLGWPGARVVPYAVDHSIFKPREKKLQVAYMPRKR